MNSEWHYKLDGVEHGPMTAAELLQIVEGGKVPLTDLAWQKHLPAERQPAKFLIANLAYAFTLRTEPQVVSVTVGRRSGLGAGYSTIQWPDDCSAQREATYWSLAALATESTLARPVDWFFLAACYFDLGLLYHNTGQFPRADWAYDEAQAIRERVVQSAPDNPDFQNGLAASYNQRGLLRHEQGELREAEELYVKAIAIRRQQLLTHPDDSWTSVLLGGALCNLGNVLCDQTSYKDALEFYDQAITLIESGLAGLKCGALAAIWNWINPSRRAKRRIIRSTGEAYLTNSRMSRERAIEQLGQER